MIQTLLAAFLIASAGGGHVHRTAVRQVTPPLTISAVNSNGVSVTPSTGSYATQTVLSGTQVVKVTIPVTATWSGALGCWMTHGNATQIQIPNWQIVNQGIGPTTGIASAATGTWAMQVQGPGTFYVTATAWSSGSFTPVISISPGILAPAGYMPYAAVAIEGLTLVTGKPCQIGGLSLMNTDSGPIYLVCFDAASTGAVTLGTTAPAFVVPYPQSNVTAANGTADRLGLPAGVTFQNGLVIAAVTLPGGSTLSTNGLTGSILWH